VLDFYCAELKLAIELDGGQHFETSGLIHDQRELSICTCKALRSYGSAIWRYFSRWMPYWSRSYE
jgi:very-short-patch-repair endonuclease